VNGSGEKPTGHSASRSIDVKHLTLGVHGRIHQSFGHASAGDVREANERVAGPPVETLFLVLEQTNDRIDRDVAQPQRQTLRRAHVRLLAVQRFDERSGVTTRLRSSSRRGLGRASRSRAAVCIGRASICANTRSVCGPMVETSSASCSMRSGLASPGVALRTSSCAERSSRAPRCSRRIRIVELPARDEPSYLIAQLGVRSRLQRSGTGTLGVRGKLREHADERARDRLARHVGRGTNDVDDGVDARPWLR
jgi:hypothetical protein